MTLMATKRPPTAMCASSTAVDYRRPAAWPATMRADRGAREHGLMFRGGAMLKAGDEAPDFSLESDEGDTVTLSALRGRPVVFYFYPKDDTPGCTTQACSLRDSYSEIAALGAALYGISPDDSESHRCFRAKFGLPSALPVVSRRSVAKSYRVGIIKPNRSLGIPR